MSTINEIRTQARIALGVLALGFVLLTYMITMEDEPGALPLLLVCLGSAGYAISRYRMHKHRV